MCTSDVAGHTQRLVSMGKIRTNGLRWISMQWQDCITMVYHDTKKRFPFLLMVWCQNGGVVVVDDESVAKMSGGDIDVEPSLSSQNTLGNGNHNSSSQTQMWQNCVGV